MEKVFDPIRKKWLIATPEEKVRQSFILHMLQLGFPPSCISLEKHLKHLPNIHRAPFRRFDIICYSKAVDLNKSLSPLLLVECKAENISQKAIDQVIGYNHYVKAFFICVSTPSATQTGWYNKNENAYTFIDYLPSYKELCLCLKQVK